MKLTFVANIWWTNLNNGPILRCRTLIQTLSLQQRHVALCFKVGKFDLAVTEKRKLLQTNHMKSEQDLVARDVFYFFLKIYLFILQVKSPTNAKCVAKHSAKAPT